MSSKKVPLGGKPTAKKPAQEAAVDARVGTRSHEEHEEPKEPMKRLTIDIPADLHAALKSDCALRGRKMADEIRDMLAGRYRKG